MLIIAHRGASAEAPENTLTAIGRAIDAQADGIEIDIYQVDGEIFVFHDRYLERLTAHPGRLQDLTAGQIRTLKVFGQQPVPTLEEVLTFINGQCMLNIEIKGEVDPDKLCHMLDLALNRYHFQQPQLIVSSFNHHWLKHMKSQCPWLQLGALSANCMLDYAAFATALNAYSVHACVDFVNQQLVDDAHQRGMPIYVYTVDQAQDIEWLKKMGVDGIFTNHPQYARNVLSGLPVSQNEMLWHH
ncbi:glycerophosphodiester phosphodiesterase [Aliidiomarina minuta]|uniref:Glycerophosphodiester phosphodiesterase n=1 Tax=Aliidiomarina minuta TaxID=880057 RepID=A0A432W414_9GAMM|nr:glycerophosphodiester phosphodiesterase family protein [Aliidiomarina minuta]RUO24071.1 glycerophosphodiester phosphodiesterase [Aliidiomarina minuta]